MTVIVTGATGFIGSHLVEALVEAGDEVRCLVRRPGPVDSPAAARFHHTDFARTDLGLADSVFDGVDSVYHVAGATRAVSAAEFHEANVAITTRLLDRVAQGQGTPPRFVYISSQAAAGPTPASAKERLADGTPALTENDPPTPIEPYGRSKLAAEQVVLGRSSELPVTVVRPPAVYGPRDKDFLSIFRLLRRGFAVYPGIRDSIVTTIFVNDLVQGIIQAGRSPAAVGRTYFMGHQAALPWRAIYRAVGDVVGRNQFREINIPIGAVRLAGIAGDLIARASRRPPLLSSGKTALASASLWTCSSDHAKNDFGFTAGTSLHDGMRATYDWYLRHQWL